MFKKFLLTSLIVFAIVGCQQKAEQKIEAKSEIDKCVEAIVKAVGPAANDPLGIRPESKDEKTKARVEAEARLECLRAQAGGR